ncbi:hypothetical protein GFS60_06906 (plasmid) [Rhodococcus sp. WAY2]|nr:hypothetical protein GFS60_06906 [Rhodococcus sp. WAY2]
MSTRSRPAVRRVLASNPDVAGVQYRPCPDENAVARMLADDPTAHTYPTRSAGTAVGGVIGGRGATRTTCTS